MPSKKNKPAEEKLCDDCLKPMGIMFDGRDSYYICNCGYDELIGPGDSTRKDDFEVKKSLE